MTSTLLSVFRRDLLEEASGLIPKYGFSDPTLFPLAIGTLKERDAYKDNKALSDVDLRELFPRGFPIALVEHIAGKTNNAAYRRLEECFNKAVILEYVAKNGDLYQAGKYKPPGVKNVVEEALFTKFNALLPYIKHWPGAVALEWRPLNAPFAIKNVAEFVDTTCYYAERMENLSAVIASGNVLLQSRLSDSKVFFSSENGESYRNQKSEADAERFWRSFASSVPLSSGPHVGEGFCSYEWYIKRTKVATAFSLGMLSFIGEEKGQGRDTKAMIKCITDTLL